MHGVLCAAVCRTPPRVPRSFLIMYVRPAEASSQSDPPNQWRAGLRLGEGDCSPFFSSFFLPSPYLPFV